MVSGPLQPQLLRQHLELPLNDLELAGSKSALNVTSESRHTVSTYGGAPARPHHLDVNLIDLPRNYMGEKDFTLVSHSDGFLEIHLLEMRFK